ncbi:MAG: polysaccharide deacetylase family protein, partial [Treponema sp.]|nr:polysaccharide deacetylase family protein [Treponema sp.]
MTVPRNLFVLGLFFGLLIIPCWGKIRFSGLDLAEDNRMLFKVESIGGDTQSALFFVQVPSPDLLQLTSFPERMELAEGGRTILVHNAFGTQRIPVSGGLPGFFSGSFSFSGVTRSSVEKTAVSPDGQWLLYMDPTSHAKGTLYLVDNNSGQKLTVSSGVERPGRFFPARWSRDSRGFFYTKDGGLYFYSVNTQTFLVEEHYRFVGEGAINSIFWDTGGSIYFFKGSTIYKLRSNELFMRAFYPGFLELGETAGKIPFEFDPNFDHFWIAPDGLSLLFCKGGRNVFYYPLGIQDDTRTDYASLPYIMTPRTGALLEVLWSADGIVTVLVGDPAGGRASIYRLTNRVIAGRTSKVFETLENPTGLGIQALLSPDGNRVVFWGKNGLYLYDYRTWRLLSRLISTPVISCLWLGNDELVVGGEERIERIRLSGTVPGERRLLCLASVSRYGYEDGVNTGVSGILAFSGNSWYKTDGKTPWTAYQGQPVREAAHVSEQYRIYLEDREGSFFENVPMVRQLSPAVTFSIFEQGKTVAGRQGIRKISLCFDLYDDASGFGTVLDILKRFGIKATFFINGEFIRHNPDSARYIAENRHEVGNMFFSNFDLTDMRYRVNADFIKRGLAITEDEFFHYAGTELSLLWHSPNYAVNSAIIEAGRNINYSYIGMDIDPYDW